jgi:hypothetical protein
MTKTLIVSILFHWENFLHSKIHTQMHILTHKHTHTNQKYNAKDQKSELNFIQKANKSLVRRAYKIRVLFTSAWSYSIQIEPLLTDTVRTVQ